MKNRIFKTVTVFWIILCICLPPSGRTAAEERGMLSLFNSFSDYADINGLKMLPSGVAVRSEYRKTRLSAYNDSSARYGDAMSVGYLAEPLIPFNKLINSNKLHVSFDIKATDINLRNIYIGFYDGRNSNDPNDFGLEQYSMAMLMERGTVYAIQGNSEKTSGGDMQSWGRNSSAGVTYIADKWYTVDFEFDMDNNTASYYFDGVLLNKTPVGTARAKGFKSLLFRCEVPKTDSDGYIDQEAAFIIDNISIDEYTDEFKIGNLKENYVSPDNHNVYVSCADYIETPSENDISVMTSDRNAVDFTIKESDDGGFLINIPDLIPGEKYSIDISNIRGTKFGALGRNNIILNVAGSKNCYFSDTFDLYDNESFAESWTPTVDGGTVISGESGYNRAAKIMSAEGGTKSGIEHSFTKAITDDNFTVEATLKMSGAFDIGFKDINGNTFSVLGAKVNGIIGCYTAAGTISGTSGGRISTPYNDLNIKNSNSEFERIKLSVDRKNKIFTVATAAKVYEFEYNYTMNDICGISITAQNAIGSVIYLDEISVKMPDSGVYAEFGINSTSSGGMFYSETINSLYGRVLSCSKSNGITDGTVYYEIEKAKGTMIVKTDADSGIDCNGAKNIRFETEYFDSGYGWFCVEYETPSGTKTSSAICMKNSGEIKKESFIINDWIKNADGEYKITLKTYTTINDGRITERNRNYSKYPVVLKSIRMTDIETSAYVKASVSTENSGNIFFENETPMFNISLKNDTVNDKDVKCSVYVCEKDKYGSESLIYSTASDTKVSGADTKSIEIAVPINKFGLYKLKVEITGDGLYNADETDFSKCAAVSTQNYTMGTSAHFTRYGDAETGAELLKKAGMGLVRDDFTWNEYEKKKGVYALTERQQKLCDAAVKYDLGLLPIVYGNNSLYDSTGSEFISDAAMPNYLEFVKNILSEPKMMAATDMVELWNEPDLKKTRNGEYIEQYADRGKIYGDILRESAKTVREIPHNYKIGAFCLSNLISTDGRTFMDMALSRLTGGKYFDTIALHPYMAPNVDPEKGKAGADSNSATDYVGYRINYIKALAEGKSVYNYVSKASEYPKGIKTGNQYGFTLTEPMWHTEYGISTANYANDGLCVGDEYSQAIWLVRGFNQIKLNNFDDKVWFYDFADDGDRINEKEYNFGIMHSYTNNVPYSAKYAYLALAAFNKLTEGATSASEVVANDYKYIAKYHSDDRDSYLLWTSKTSEQTIEYDFGGNVKFYDLLGNEIDKESIMQDGRYKISGEPYWAIVGKEPNYCTVDENKSKLYVVKDGIGTENAEMISPNKSFGVLAKLDGTSGIDRVLIAAAYGDNRLKEIKMYDVDENTSCQVFESIAFDDKDINKIKIMLCESVNSMKPLCTHLKINKL